MKKKVTHKRSSTFCDCGSGTYWFSYYLIGMGVGILFTNPVINPHPVRYGLGFILMGVLLYVGIQRIKRHK